jgi:hypothetical protein
VPGGGLASGANRWIACRPGFFSLSAYSPACFAAYSCNIFERPSIPANCSSFLLWSLGSRNTFAEYLRPLCQTEWIVYAKRPFAGAEQVLDYLARYTHRVAISNNRLLNIKDGKVIFRWKDYRHYDQPRTMTLAPITGSYPVRIDDS